MPYHTYWNSDYTGAFWIPQPGTNATGKQLLACCLLNYLQTLIEPKTAPFLKNDDDFTYKWDEEVSYWQNYSPYMEICDFIEPLIIRGLFTFFPRLYKLTFIARARREGGKSIVNPNEYILEARVIASDSNFEELEQVGLRTVYRFRIRKSGPDTVRGGVLREIRRCAVVTRDRWGLPRGEEEMAEINRATLAAEENFQS